MMRGYTMRSIIYMIKVGRGEYSRAGIYSRTGIALIDRVTLARLTRKVMFR